MRTKSKISAYILRGSVGTLLVSCGVVALSSAINLPNYSPKFPAPQNNTAFEHESGASAIQRNRTLTFADRVAYQRAIEDVYWRHRIWPKANAGPKPPLDKVMSQAEIQRKVEDYLRNSQALEDYWQRPMTPDQLQAEMERMASYTKQPEVLRELFAALGDDPFVIAECLARPLLAERLLTELYAHDERFHGELKRRAEAQLRAHRGIGQMNQTSGMYTEMEWIKSDSAEDSSGPVDTTNPGAIRMNGSEWQERVQKLANDFCFGVWRHVAAFQSVDMSAQSKKSAADEYETLPMGKLSPLQEDDGHYYAVAVMKKVNDRLKLATVAWPKEPLGSWVAKAEAQRPLTMAAVNANYTVPLIADTCTEAWTPTSTTNAPAARYRHTAVWTGSEMIVWGGYVNGVVNTGGRYNPSTDSWTATSLTNAPAAREFPTAVWTGTEMIVWGGSPYFFYTGGRYNPGTDSWAATSTTGAPFGREFHVAVWTGSEMIVWGGNGGDNTGGRYNPSTDSWTATSTTNAPAAPRWSATAVWTGSEMIVWGGAYAGNYFNTGGRYDPSTDSWTATSTTNSPAGRDLHTAVWTGSEMIVWGGEVGNSNPSNTGGRYNPSSNSWTATSLTNAPDPRDHHTAVWTGNEMIVWGGDDNVSVFNTGRRYNPGTDSWTATSLINVPSVRELHTAVWSGSQMIVWAGGGDHGLVRTGGRYCPAADVPPTPTPTPGARLRNISTRSFVQTGDNVMIGGFIVHGTTPKRVIIRAIGPELARFGVPNVLANPTLELHNGAGALIGRNDNWRTTIIGGIITHDQVQDIRSSGLAPGDTRESAIVAELPAGNYTAIVRGINSTVGVALVEVYDLALEDPPILFNISTRSFVQTGDNVMIGGFIVHGTGSERVIIRAIGPELSRFGVPEPLQNPTLELHNGAGALIGSNDNWRTTIIGGVITSDQVQEIRSSGYAPGDGRESAIIADLQPGNYTAIVRGVNSTTGVALVEVYDLQ